MQEMFTKIEPRCNVHYTDHSLKCVIDNLIRIKDLMSSSTTTDESKIKRAVATFGRSYYTPIIITGHFFLELNY